MLLSVGATVLGHCLNRGLDSAHTRHYGIRFPVALPALDDLDLRWGCGAGGGGRTGCGYVPGVGRGRAFSRRPRCAEVAWGVRFCVEA